MPRGVSPKREHEFEKLKHQFQHDHRYPGREEEVAARIVNKQRREAGEIKSSSDSSSGHANSGGRGSSASSKSSSASTSANAHASNPGLSVKEYAGLTIPEVTSRLGSLSLSQIRRLRDYELAHKHRKGMLEKLNRQLVH
ncbi:hypothetical protein LG204_10610 [Methylovorus menthalis]|uniref:hypothetical protein n=1 Tax=Methylovorus menthalis TaxID=1002227 RepID=UPI001E46570B|nr:hypothetical protein [Methylovorus menthalis]MCB4811767.1 hypothetical protein [Methylovorus menthalis]